MFEKRYVTFVDILGFKEIVKKAESDEDYQKEVSDVLNYIANIRDENYNGIFSKYGINSDVSVFSDSIVISHSCKEDDADALYELLIDLMFLCIDLIDKGIYVRGGVVFGDIIHNKNISWGPALIEAYKLEENDAIYPRIIIDKNAIDNAKEKYAVKYPYDIDGSGLDRLILLDADGAYYLDYLSQYSEFDDYDNYIKWLNHIRTNIELNLKKSLSPRIKMKYVWFANYYNKTISDLSKEYGLQAIEIANLNKGAINK